jgi:hypothetical protein
MSEEDTDPEPEPGEIRELTGISWDPCVLVTCVEDDSDGNRLDRFAIIDQMDDGALTPVPDSYTETFERSVGDRDWRRSIAQGIDDNDEIDKRWCPVERLAVLGAPGIQGCDPIPEVTSA